LPEAKDAVAPAFDQVPISRVTGHLLLIEFPHVRYRR
jgi:hypothetical protein